jgi:Flp pilus assembly protein TadG
VRSPGRRTRGGRRHDGRGGDERGAAALEFGLVAPVMFLLLFGMLQYGYLFWSLTTASATAREAVRRMVVGNEWTTCAQKWAVTHARNAAVGDRTVTVTRSYTDRDGVPLARQPQPGDTVTVTVSFRSLDLGIPLLPMPDHGTVTQSARGEVQNVPAGPLPCEGPGNP